MIGSNCFDIYYNVQFKATQASKSNQSCPIISMNAFEFLIHKGILFFESCSFSIVLLLYGTVALLILLLLLSSCCCYCIMLLQKYCVAILQRWQRRDSMWEFSTLSALTIESPLLASQHHLSVSFQICDDCRDLPTNPFMFLIAIQSPIRNSIPT